MDKLQPIFRLVQVKKTFDRQVVLGGVDLEIFPGQTTVIIGPSGCGKTVLLKHLIGLLKPDSGKVFFGDQEISALSERALLKIRRKMGFLFQSGALFDSMTVQENVCFPLTEHGVGTKQERIARCAEVLKLMAMEHTSSKYPEELSGGQKKRVALARAIVLAPEVILYDEPTTGLDPIRADIINELILMLAELSGTTAIVVTHDMNSARKVGDRIIMLHEGKFIADAAPQALSEVDDVVVARFIEGRASNEELAQIRRSAKASSHNLKFNHPSGARGYERTG